MLVRLYLWTALGLPLLTVTGCGSTSVKCPANQLLCNDKCIDPTTDRIFCGATDCEDPNGRGEACAPGHRCVGDGFCYLSCQEGMVNCNGKCIDPDTNNDYCGASECFDDSTDGEQCADGYRCNGAGVCALTCQQGLVDCAGQCVNPDFDRNFCGATTCQDDTTDGDACLSGFVCNGAGSCQASCASGFVDCGGICIDPLVDETYCGATTCQDDTTDGEQCDPGYICNGSGQCQRACQAGYIDCNGLCVDPSVDRRYCGATTCADDATDGEQCDSGHVCNGQGMCELSCQPGLVDCYGICIHPGSNRFFCGATTCADDTTDGEQCDWADVCIAGICQATPFSSCADIVASGASSGDGIYAVSIAGAPLREVYCDMTSLGSIGITYVELGFGRFDQTYADFEILDLSDMQTPQFAEFFIWAYNDQGGLINLDIGYRSTNCCFRDKNAATIAFGASYLYPSTGVGSQCNPAAGYTEPLMQFFRPVGATQHQPPLPSDFFINFPIGASTQCTIAQNPGFFVRRFE